MIQLRIYHEYLECVRALRAVVRLIQKYDYDLGRQLRRAMASVTLDHVAAVLWKLSRK